MEAEKPPTQSTVQKQIFEGKEKCTRTDPPSPCQGCERVRCLGREGFRKPSHLRPASPDKFLTFSLQALPSPHSPVPFSPLEGVTSWVERTLAEKTEGLYHWQPHPAWQCPGREVKLSGSDCQRDVNAERRGPYSPGRRWKRQGHPGPW